MIYYGIPLSPFPQDNCSARRYTSGTINYFVNPPVMEVWSPGTRLFLLDTNRTNATSDLLGRPQDASIDNGCLHYIPGSHKWDLLPVTGLADDMASIKRVLNGEQWETFQSPEAVELKAGQVVFHHPLAIHGSFENRTGQSRRLRW